LFLADFGILDLSVSPASLDHVECSPSPFIAILLSLLSSANVINIIYIPASWSSSRYSLFRKMKILSLEPDLGLISAKPHMMYTFTVKNEPLITTL